jgi:two-component system sensor histidine kinase AlgZ
LQLIDTQSTFRGEPKVLDARPGHENDAFPTFWQVQLVAWTGMYLSGIIVNLPDLKAVAIWQTSAFTLVTFGMSCLLRPVCRSLMRRSLSWVALEFRAFAWCVPAGIPVGFASELATYPLAFNWGDWIGYSVQGSFTLFVWCSLYYSIKLWQQSIREQARLLRAESEVREARLSALRFQLNPHFLFNSLNAASTLVLDGDSLAATRMLSQIADFLRTILDAEALPETPLAREIAWTEKYLAIEQTRLGNRLLVETSFAPDTLGAFVPTMLLQPLVENAVRHGVAPLVEGGTIRISSEIRNSRLRICIWNTVGQQAPARSNGTNGGIGISNTVARLKTLYGDDCALSLERDGATGCETSVEIPFRSGSTEPERV